MIALVVSDIHANQVALEAVLAACPTVDAVWNLGDTVGYGPRPGECLDRVIDLPASPALAGNHDLACIGALDLSQFNRAAQLATRWTARLLRPDHRDYLAALPSWTTCSGVTLAHGSPRAPVWEYVIDVVGATDNFRAFDTNLCLIGHTHVAMVATLSPDQPFATLRPLRDAETVDLATARHLINPGSVGQPRDGDPRAAFAILDTGRGTLTGHRVAYDVAETQRQMALADLPDVLIARLGRGR